MRKRNGKPRSPRSSGDEFYFDEDKARVAVELAECFRLREGNQLLKLLPYQREAVRNLFGWRIRASKRRRYRRVSIWIPRGNGKTPFGALIAILLLLLEGERAMEIYSVASDREQARISYEDGSHMVTSSDALAPMFEPFRRELRFPATDSVWKVMSSDARTKHGYRPYAVIFDELHTQKTRNLWDAMKTGLGKGDRDTLLITISTAGVYDPESLGYTEYSYAKKIAAGQIDDPHHLVVIFEASPDVATDGRWSDPDVWAECNPGLGVTLQRSVLEDEARQAKEDPAALSSFLQLRLNIWVNAAVAAIHPESWTQCERPILVVDKPTAYGGMDIGEKDDLAALGLCIPNTSGEYSFVIEPYIARDKVESLKSKHGVDYPLWVLQGWIRTSGENCVDVEELRARFRQLREVYRIKEIAYDAWHATQVAVKMSSEDNFKMIEVPQTMKHLSEPTKEFLRLIESGKARFGDSPVTRWMASNLVLFRDGKGNVVYQKQAKSAKIDGMVAAINAFARAIVAPAKPTSVYETRGAIIL